MLGVMLLGVVTSNSDQSSLMILCMFFLQGFAMNMFVVPFPHLETNLDDLFGRQVFPSMAALGITGREGFEIHLKDVMP